MKTLLILIALTTITTTSARAEMSEGARESLKAGAYMGTVIGAGSRVIQGTSAGKTVMVGLGAGATAAAVTGGVYYFYLPTDQKDAPDQNDLNVQVNEVKENE